MPRSTGPAREGVERELAAQHGATEVIPLMLQDRLLARRLDVAVMFTDVVDFTAYSSGMEPDEVFSQLNEFFGAAGEIIGRYRGYINKTNGDGIMALFGVPFESATYQTDAVLAALAIQRETGAQFPFGMRVGINTGTVTAASGATTRAFQRRIRCGEPGKPRRGTLSPRRRLSSHLPRAYAAAVVPARQTRGAGGQGGRTHHVSQCARDLSRSPRIVGVSTRPAGSPSITCRSSRRSRQ